MVSKKKTGMSSGQTADYRNDDVCGSVLVVVIHTHSLSQRRPAVPSGQVQVL